MSYDPKSSGFNATSYQGRLPGTPGGWQAPAYSSPQGLYEYVMANVPGISADAATWLQSRLLGGQTVTGDTLAAQLGGLTMDQINAIGALSPFMGGASTTSGAYTSDPPLPLAPSGGTPGGGPPPAPSLLPRQPVVNDASGAGFVPTGPITELPPGNYFPPLTDNTTPRPIHQPPQENQNLPNYATNMEGFPYGPPVAPPGGIDFGDYGNTGANYAERHLGVSLPQPLDDPYGGVPGPIKHLRRRHIEF